MKDFREIYKALARANFVMSADVIARAVFIGMETDNPVRTAKQIISRAFTPITRKVKLDNGRQPLDAVVQTLGNILNWNSHDALETVEEKTEFKNIVRSLLDSYRPSVTDQQTRRYVYIFVRQDIAPEYQAVQACHAAAKMGSRNVIMALNEFDELYFTLIGVPNLEAMAVAIRDCKSVEATVYPFYEPDIGNVMTAFATSPVLMKNRKRLLAYKKLKFNE